MLNVQNITISHKKTKQQIVTDLSFSVGQNECLAIVGESGSGKSMTAKAILQLLPHSFTASGDIYWQNQSILQLPQKKMRLIRGKQISLILQNAMACFNPLMTIGKQMTETIREHEAINNYEAERRAILQLERMNIQEAKVVFDKYPHQLSGGMLQRIMIALTFVLKPQLIIADEPTTALDPINQIEIMSEFEQLYHEENCSLIFISHDLAIVQQIAQSVLVMKDGKQVEYGKTETLFSEPDNDYTKYLIKTRKEIAKPFTSLMKG